MGQWLDLPAVWVQAANNFGDGDYVTGEPSDAISGVYGIALHIAEGTGLGTVSWCSNPNSDVGPHFVVDTNGQITQMVDTDDRSWCQGDGNSYWLSVENAGWSGNPLTLAQIEANARILAKAHQVYKVPLQITDSVSKRGLGWHGMGGASWGNHTNCPGAPILAQRPAIIARAQQILHGEDDMKDDERAWLARCTEILSALATGNPVMWTKERVRAQDQLNALTTQIDVLTAELQALTAAFTVLAENGTNIDTAVVLQAIREIGNLVKQDKEAELAAALAEAQIRQENL